MFGLLLSAALLAQSPTLPSDDSRVRGNAVEPAETQVEPRSHPRAPQRLLIGAGVAYGLGSGIQWATAAGTGILAAPGSGGLGPDVDSGLTLGMTLGGMTMVQGLTLGTIGGRNLARASHGHDDRARPMIAGGALVAGFGGAAIVGASMLWPSIRARCPIGAGCALAAIHVGGAALSLGAGMMSYGHVLLQRDPNHRPVSQRAQTPLIAGTVLLGSGYLMAAGIGLAIWQEQPDDPLARRIRNRLLIPVVGPWIHAAGPDASPFVAVLTGGLGALQIGGALAAAVGAGIAGSERKRERASGWVRVVPRLDGIALVGQF